MSDYRSDLDNPTPPRRVVVPVRTGRIGTDQLFPDRDVIGHNKDEKGNTGPIEFVRLPDGVGKPLIEDEDYTRAVKLLVQKEGLSEGILTLSAEGTFRGKFVENTSQILVDRGDPTKADQLYKMGFEMLMKHYREKTDGAAPLASVEGILEANKNKILPSGKGDAEWFDNMLADLPNI